MAKLIRRLTALAVEKLKRHGYHADGGGLYLQVSRSGSKSWVFRYMLNHRSRDMGLGSLHDVSLEQARTKAKRCRALLDLKEDPILHRQAADQDRALKAASAKTFDECAAAFIETHRAAWKNAKHAAQWENTLATYASPIFGKLPLQAVDDVLVLKVLEPIWRTKTETASRVRGRIELVLDWAKARKYRTGENPARWRGHLDKLLPKRSKIAPPKNHPAIPYEQAPEFLSALRTRQGIAPKALEFVILTAARVSEAVNATWDEVDTRARTWTVPASRMKAAKSHRVPLSDAALRVITEMRAQKQTDFIFPGWRIKRAITGAACLKLLRDMGRRDLTVHGFRSTFRDWCAEQTAYPRDVCEMALAHTINNRTEAAYRRGDLFEKRARLMCDWATYLAAPKIASVTPIRRKKA